MNKTKQLHPLLTKGENQHYKGRKAAIRVMEENMTVNELSGWCIGSIFKYRLRNKGQDLSDEKKISDYNRYLTTLEEFQKLGFGEMLASEVQIYLKIKYDYET